MFKVWCGNVTRRYAYFVEHGHSWEYEKKDKNYRWLGKDHPYKGGKTKAKTKDQKEERKSQEEEVEQEEEEVQREEEETDSEMPPLEPIPGIQPNDGEEEEEDSEEDEYDAEAHQWNAGSSAGWNQPTWQSASSSWEGGQYQEWCNYYSPDQYQYQDVDNWWKNHPGGGKDDQDGES